MIMESFFNILLIVGLVLFTIQVVQWFIIVLNPFRMFFNIEEYSQSNEEYLDLLNKFQTLSMNYK